MSLEDPFYTVRDDVRDSLNNAQKLYSQWCMLLEDQSDLDKLQTTSTDLRSCIKSIEWDLQDLEETISIAETNPQKFRLSVGELETRKHFIRDTRHVVDKIKTHMTSAQAQGVMENMKRQQLLTSSSQRKPRGRYQKLEEELERSNQDYIDQQQHQQQMLLTQQDQKIDKVSGTIGVLHKMGQDIGIELDEQNKMIDDIDDDI